MVRSLSLGMLHEHKQLPSIPHAGRIDAIPTEEGISVSVPALPGCWSEGDTEEEALANIQDAIRDYLAALEDRFKDAELGEVEVTV